MPNLLKHYYNQTDKNTYFQNALNIVKKNINRGNIWVIGGSVYRSIVASLYNTSQKENFDFDFIVEKPTSFKELFIPAGWKVTKTSLGEPRLIKGNLQIDMVSKDYPLILKTLKI